MLGEMYEVKDLLEWLVKDGIGENNCGAAYEFGIVPEGVDRMRVLTRSSDVLEKGGKRRSELLLRILQAKERSKDWVGGMSGMQSMFCAHG